jgi:hypothetical protein
VISKMDAFPAAAVADNTADNKNEPTNIIPI